MSIINDCRNKEFHFDEKFPIIFDYFIFIIILVIFNKFACY